MRLKFAITLLAETKVLLCENARLFLNIGWICLVQNIVFIFNHTGEGAHRIRVQLLKKSVEGIGVITLLYVLIDKKRKCVFVKIRQKCVHLKMKQNAENF